MMKRKMGFGLGSLLTSKSSKGKDFADDWDPVNDPLSPIDVSYAGRPRLDPRTELELRKACAIVVQDLKPSGYDVEDTRMKSDIFVDDSEEEEERRHKGSSHHREKKSLAQAPWVAERSNSSSGRINPNDVVKERQPERRQHTARIRNVAEDSLPDFRDSPKSPTLPHPLKSQPARHIVSAESPAAPLQSIQDLTSIGATMPAYEERTSTSQRGESASTASSQYTTNTNDPRSTSTGLTSAPITPSLDNSKFIDVDLRPSYTDAAEREKSKQEAERRRLYESSAIALRNGLAAHPVNEKKSPGQARSQSRQTQNDGINDALYHTNGFSTSHKNDPKSSGDAKIKEGSSDLHEQLIQKREEKRPPQLNLSRPVVKRNLSNELRPQSPRFQPIDAPPVPSLEQYKAKREPKSPLVNGTAATYDEQPYRTTQGEEEITPEQKPFSADAKEKEVKRAKTRLSPIPTLYQPPDAQTFLAAKKQEESVKIKDFFRPTDLEAADFDILMSIMKDTKEPDSLYSKVDTVSRTNTLTYTSLNPQSRTTTLTYSGLNANGISSPTRTHTLSPRPNGGGQASSNNVNHGAIDEEESLQEAQDSPPRLDSLQGPVSPSRNSLQAVSIRSKTGSVRSGGFRRLFSRKGPSDRYARSNMYVPSPDYPRYEEEDGEYDEQACAAPVVGFGRGW